MTGELFDDAPWTERLAPGTVLLHGYGAADGAALVEAITRIAETAPFRHMVTPGGKAMSAAMTNCGAVGWVTDRKGYRYTADDPESGNPWPTMPEEFLRIATGAAAEAGFDGFVPDACLINRYAVGAKMGLHQDKDEVDFDAPIVSVSLGLPVIFQYGGMKRNDPVEKIPLEHGDVIVWGGPDRLRYHGVMTLKEGDHPLTGPYRINLTFRRAL